MVDLKSIFTVGEPVNFKFPFLCTINTLNFVATLFCELVITAVFAGILICKSLLLVKLNPS